MYKNIATQTLRKPLFRSRSVSVDVLRLDLPHPVISGNKWFKLKYHLSNALSKNKKELVSFGGAYSNHLVALAFACKENNLSSVGIVRGDEGFSDNHSIRQMKDAGMNIVFISRDEYNNKDRVISDFMEENDGYYYVPEGGKSSDGVKGAAEILSYAKKDYSHIVCAVGTGTTLAGIIKASKVEQNVVGISSLKVAHKDNNELIDYISSESRKSTFTVNFDYHFGGYARKTDELIAFMNALYIDEHIPTDFVYTGKTFYAVHDLVQKNFFENGSRVLVIHTGGLQGNGSLPPGSLVF